MAAGSGVKQAEINEIQYFRNLCFLPLTHSGVIAGEVILEAVTNDIDGVFKSILPRLALVALKVSYLAEEMKRLKPSRLR